MKKQLTKQQHSSPKKNGPSPIAVRISNGVVTDDITVDDMRIDKLLRDILEGWPLCVEHPIVHVRKLFSIDDETIRLRIVVFVAAIHKSFWKRIGNDKTVYPDFLDGILAVGPNLRKPRYRRRAREAAIAVALLHHWHHLHTVLKQIRTAFQDADLHFNTHRFIRLLSDAMQRKLLELDSDFLDRDAQGPINNPFMH